MRGRFDRNEIRYFSPQTGYTLEYAYVKREEQHPEYGWVGIACLDWCCHDGSIVIYWRPTRNAVSEWKVEHIAKFNNQEEAEAAFKETVSNYQVPQRPERYRARRPRDSQRQKVYDWEFKYIKFGRTKLWKKPELKALLKRMCSELDIPERKRPRLYLRSGGRMSFYRKIGNEIRLLPVHHFSSILIHEFAHFYTDYYYNNKPLPSHGKEFMGLYVYLLVKFDGRSLGHLLNTLEEDRIKVEIPPEFEVELLSREEAAA